MKKRFKHLFLTALFVFVALGSVYAEGNRDTPALPVVQELVILHTNDHHGTTVSKDGKMGLAERAAFVKQVRNIYNNVLILDAGDINTGTALSNMYDAEPDIKAYDLIGYKAVAIGNHEFDKPFSTLEKQIAKSKFDFVSANITRPNGSYLEKPYIIQDYDGFRVAVIGLTTLRSKVTARPDASLKFIPEIDAAKAMVKRVRETEKADIVIIVGHVGDVLETEDQTTSKMVVEALADAGLKIDLFIDGHSHSALSAPIVVANTPIVSSHEWGKFMGEAVLKIKDKKVIDFFWKPVEITSAKFPPDPAVLTLLKPYIDGAQASLKEIVMKTSAVFPFNQGSITRIPRYRETASGNLTSDSYTWFIREKLGVAVDFAITNGGGIRAALPEGNVTREAIKTMLPFDNWVFFVRLPGSKVKEMFDHAASQNQGSGGFPQISREVKLELTYDADGTHGKVTSLTINGAPIDDNKIYAVATNDFMAGGGDGYTSMKTTETFNTSMWLADVVVEYAKTLPQPVKPTTDGRLTVIGGVSP
ncbi:bifunctional UDP-sugar hydrolase/5'-nucleotidase [Spirochaetia bacterium]|nr:bifunctional UDP-sugar hydrolase/5'-nucleotidase [Spirochaetia bacterium]